MRNATDIRHEIDAKRQSRSADAAIARLASRQHGVVARAQLVALGLGHGEIDDRVARRRLHPVHRGVFAVGHRALTREAAWTAAVLAAGPPRRSDPRSGLPLARHRLVAELDGYGTHGTRRAFERDRQRDRKLQAAGYRVIRITGRQLTDDPDTIASELRELLRDTVSPS